MVYAKFRACTMCRGCKKSSRIKVGRQKVGVLDPTRTNSSTFSCVQTVD